MNNIEGQAPKKKGFASKLILILVLLILAAAVVMRLRKPEEEVETTPLPTVSVQQAQNGTIELETSLIGQLTSGDVYYVTPKAAGEIREIYVEQGDTVEEGDPICKIDNQKQIDSAKISLDSAKVSVQTYKDSVATAQTNLDRMAALLGTGDISSQAYEQTKSAYDQAVSGLKAAQLQLEAAQLQYDTQVEYATVTAPVGGRVESESMELNALASQSTQLCVISGNSAKKVQFSVTDRLLSALQVGDSLRIEKQGEVYEGTVSNLSTMVNQTTGLYLVEAAVADDGEIPAGASVKVYFVSEAAEDVLTVPTDAVYYDGGKNYVYTLTYNEEGAEVTTDAGEAATVLAGNKAGTVHKVEVEIGLSDTERTELVSGIGAEDFVIVSWTNQLYEGAQVQVLPENAAAAAAPDTEAAKTEKTDDGGSTDGGADSETEAAASED